MDNEIQDKINSILDNFDFEKMHKVMTFLNWRWATIGEIPDIADLRVSARGLLKEAYNNLGKLPNADYFIQTGGFRAETFRLLDGRIDFSLSFVVTDWDTFA